MQAQINQIYWENECLLEEIHRLRAEEVEIEGELVLRSQEGH